MPDRNVARAEELTVEVYSPDDGSNVHTDDDYRASARQGAGTGLGWWGTGSSDFHRLRYDVIACTLPRHAAKSPNEGLQSSGRPG
jgi:hypothetical protein